MFTASLVFGGEGLGSWRQWFDRQRVYSNGSTYRLIGHAFSLTGLYFVSRYVLETNIGASGLWFAIWFLLAAVTFLSWLALISDPREWMRLLIALRGGIAIALVTGLCAVAGGELSQHSWSFLAVSTFRFVDVLLSVAGFEVIRDASEFLLGTPQFMVRISPQCSGYEGMGLAVVFVATYLWWRRSEHQFPHSLILIPISVALMFLANVLRIAALIVIGHCGWTEFAVGGFHSQAGWLGFNLVVLGIILAARCSPWFLSGTESRESPSQSISVPMLAPFIVLTLTSIAAGAFLAGFDWGYPLRVVAVAGTLTCFRKHYDRNIRRRASGWNGPVIGVIVFLVWLALEGPADPAANQEYKNQLSGQPALLAAAWIVFRVLGSAVTVPLAEEFAFRGYLLPLLSGGTVRPGLANGSWMAIAISSVAFGILHPGHWIAGTIAGVLFACAYCRRALLMDAVVAHATANLLLSGVVLLNGQWSLWN